MLDLVVLVFGMITIPRTINGLFDRAFIAYYRRDRRLRDCIESFDLQGSTLRIEVIPGTGNTLLVRMAGIAKWIRQTGTPIHAIRYNGQEWRINTILALAGVDATGEGVQDRKLRQQQKRQNN